jgi:hypothetical protein
MVTDMSGHFKTIFFHTETRRRGELKLLRVSASPRESGKLF